MTHIEPLRVGYKVFILPGSPIPLLIGRLGKITAIEGVKITVAVPGVGGVTLDRPCVRSAY